MSDIANPFLPAVTRRPVQSEDLDFLVALYADTHASHLTALPLPEAQKQHLLRSQFDLQDAQYRANHPEGAFLILETEGQPIGRLSLSKSSDCLHLIDLAIAADWRGRGIGTAILKQQQEEARAAGVPVRLNVVATNPARALYERLGFQVIETQPVHVTMQWNDNSALS